MAFSKGKTTIVLGAGASKEAGFPTGSELKVTIAELLNIRYDEFGDKLISGSREIDRAFRIMAHETGERNINYFLKACWQIRDAMPQSISIDNYLDVHADDIITIVAGKLAIAKAILSSEKSSSFYFDPRSNHMIDFSHVENTWFNKFFQILTENCRLDSLSESLANVAVVSFNYDRCFEHFLFNAIQNYYRIKPQKAANILNALSIYHPYGRVGSLPWQKQEIPVEFGAEPNPRSLIHISQQIRTFTEGTDPKSSSIVGIRDSIVHCQRLIFLGFAYHPMNMELLGSKQNDFAPKVSFGTAKGLSTPDCKIVESDIRSIVGKEIISVQLRNDLTCSKLLEEYWRSLTT